MAVDKQIEKQGSASINTHGESLEPMGPVTGEGVDEAEGRGGGGGELERSKYVEANVGPGFRDRFAQRNPIFFSKC